ncbi:MAG TPA: TA system VapC family ribonuclease toxin [Thermoanaerobaculia bacterium]|nr:TA system VapC family ribonuclease toxin [Thermoanaerobaculia bacterium]
MSYAVDVNVLLYASDEASPRSKRAREFLDECAQGSEILCVGWPTLTSYLRLSTHPAIFSNPLTPEEAERNVGALLSLPHVRAVSEQDGFWDVYREVTEGLPTRGNDVPDAHLAALLKQHDVPTLFTNDRDFLRFEFLKVRNPFDADA